MTVEQEFKNPNEIGYQLLFIFIAGAIGDIVIHFFAYFTFFGKELLPYYKSLEYGSHKSTRRISSTLLGAIWGGIACLIALLIAKLFLFIKEKTEKTEKNDNDN